MRSSAALAYYVQTAGGCLKNSAAAMVVGEDAQILKTENTTKERVLESATNLMSIKGYRGTTLQEIAQNVGITHAALYYYFDSKESILIDIARKAIGEAQVAIRTALDGGGTAKERFTKALEAYTYTVLGNKGMKIYFDEARELSVPARQVIKNEEAELVNELAQAFQECQQTSNTMFPQISPKFATLAAIGMSSWANRWYNESGSLSRREAAEVITNIALYGLFVQQER